MTAAIQGPRGLKVSEVAHLLGVSPNTVRAWDQRWNNGEVPRTTPSGHRRYERRLTLGMKIALDEGFHGVDVMRRADEIVRSGRFDDPAPLVVRMTALERQLAMLAHEIRGLRAELSRR